MRENRVYTIVHVCSKLINYTTSTRDSVLKTYCCPLQTDFILLKLSKNLLI